MSIAEKVFQRISAISRNQANHVIWHDRGAAQRRTFAELFGEIEAAAQMLLERGVSRVGIVGPTCYNWLVLDLACLIGGVQSVAFPEALTRDQLAELLAANAVDLLFVHEAVQPKVQGYTGSTFRFSSADALAPARRGAITDCRIRPDYSVIFSSGSTGLPRPVTIRFRQHNYRRETSALVNQQFERFVGETAPLWKKPGNKMIIFMPFSHFQQRQFAWAALMRGCDLLLSTPNECLSHIIRERPNVMISVPSVYEALATIVEAELQTHGPVRRHLFRLAQKWGVNQLPPRRLLRQLFDAIVVGRHLRTLCGGRPEAFITGSAPIKPAALRTLWSIGVHVYDVYSQTELGIVAVNTPFDYRLGSVGKPFQDLKISADGEIMVKFDPLIHDAALVRVEADGYAHSGDMGRLDADGYLYHEGRANSVMVLKSGKKLQPEQIERELGRIDGVDHAVLFAAEDETLGLVLIVRDAGHAGIPDRLEQTLATLADHERPRRIAIVARTACPVEEFWTTSGKLVRGAVAAYGRRHAVALRPRPVLASVK